MNTTVTHPSPQQTLDAFREGYATTLAHGVLPNDTFLARSEDEARRRQQAFADVEAFESVAYMSGTIAAIQDARDVVRDMGARGLADLVAGKVMGSRNLDAGRRVR